MKIVFCKECKYFGRNRHYARCGHSNNLTIKHDWETQYEFMVREPSKINKNNNCKWFKKKIPIVTYKVGG